MPKIIFLLLIILLLCLAVLFFNEGKKEKEVEVCLQNRCFQTEVVDTEPERAKGLMFRKNLEANKGMLFIFEEEGFPAFWMKNTLIPLDLIWLNKNKEVVFVKSNFQPCKEKNCPAIAPDKEAKYVLEINANLAAQIGIEIGDKASFR